MWGGAGSRVWGFDQEIPHHSTFSKNRHGRFQESKLFEEMFAHIVRQCVEVGLVQGKHLSVDGSFVEANAAKESRIPREQLAEAAQVNQTVRQYLVELEQQNPSAEPVHQQDQVSTPIDRGRHESFPPGDKVQGVDTIAGHEWRSKSHSRTSRHSAGNKSGVVEFT